MIDRITRGYNFLNDSNEKKICKYNTRKSTKFSLRILITVLCYSPWIEPHLETEASPVKYPTFVVYMNIYKIYEYIFLQLSYRHINKQ